MKRILTLSCVIITITVTALFAGCQTPDDNDATCQASSLSMRLDSFVDGYTYAELTYRSYDELVNEEINSARNLSEDELAYEISLLPKGGYVVVYVESYYLEEASLGNWEYLVSYDDGEDERISGYSYDVPSYDYYGDYFWNIDIIYLDEDFCHAYVRVINPMTNAVRSNSVSESERETFSFIVCLLLLLWLIW